MLLCISQWKCMLIRTQYEKCFWSFFLSTSVGVFQQQFKGNYWSSLCRTVKWIWNVMWWWDEAVTVENHRTGENFRDTVASLTVCLDWQTWQCLIAANDWHWLACRQTSRSRSNDLTITKHLNVQCSQQTLSFKHLVERHKDIQKCVSIFSRSETFKYVTGESCTCL